MYFTRTKPRTQSDVVFSVETRRFRSRMKNYSVGYLWKDIELQYTV